MLCQKINNITKSFGIMNQGNTILKQLECFQAIWIRRWGSALMIWKESVLESKEK